MNDKEYTYDIDKYTIGVDENGEDGIGLTVAKVENGEIYFLGNCYGENARCIDLLIKENQQLKIQISAREEEYRKLEVYYDEELDYLYIEHIDGDNNLYCESIRKQSFINNIKAIVTKEQMEQMSYKIKE